MNDSQSYSDKKRTHILPMLSLVAYAAGAILLFISAPNIFLSPGITLPKAGPTSPLFFSMLLLAITSTAAMIGVFQRGKELKRINKIPREDAEEDVEKISEKRALRKEQSKKYFNGFVYILGILSIALALIQAWGIFYAGTAADVSVVYWGAYLAIAAAWFGYGIYYQNKAIAVIYGLGIFLEIIVINGLIFYG